MHLHIAVWGILLLALSVSSEQADGPSGASGMIGPPPPPLPPPGVTVFDVYRQLQQLMADFGRFSASVSINFDILKNCSCKPIDCSDIKARGQTTSGVYTVYVGASQTPVSVYCDMATDGGGWTVIQRRANGSVDFYQNWNNYKIGFGSLPGEFWLGNENIYWLTHNNRRYKLRIDLADFAGNTRYAVYDDFQYGSAGTKYKLLSVGAYMGTAGDSLTYHVGQSFSTFDADNDNWNGNCAVTFKGAWWYNACHQSNLNGHYYTTGITTTYADGVNWYNWLGYYYSLKFSEMKIKPW